MTAPESVWVDRLARTFRWHAWAFAGINLALTAINVATGRPWWALWPLLATAVVFGLHYILLKTFTIDEQWVDERVEKLTTKSYDRSHIEDIRRNRPERNR